MSESEKELHSNKDLKKEAYDKIGYKDRRKFEDTHTRVRYNSNNKYNGDGSKNETYEKPT